ncbi:MAG: MaoC family dehydratase, partial [Microbacterium gubbeenense]
DRVRFIAPVFIDDTITVTAEITQKRDHKKRPDEFGYVDELVSVVNHDGQTVLVLTHIYLVNKRGAH